MRNELPPFSGRTTTCEKCGYDGPSTIRYLEFGKCIHSSEAVFGYERNERLHRECDRCGYKWDEATLA